MGEPGQRLGLAQQPQAARLAAEAVRPQELDRHPAVQLGVVGGVDHPHAARPDAVEHHVAAHGGAAVEPLRGAGRSRPRDLSQRDGLGLIVHSRVSGREPPTPRRDW